ncbi:MAG TPA: SOS response-associated peptidase [Lentimicrobium sp.]|nr:SOS response-associated peptidase [Lentimicrobium sp.]
MCGRFSLTTDEQQLNLFFELSGGNAPYVPRYNGAPTQELSVITGEGPRRLQLFRWGLIPGWCLEVPKVPIINARRETLEHKPSFRNIFREKRCLVPADGFYEWVHSGRKLPYRFTLNDGSLFAFAGIWDTWKQADGKEVNSFAIITTDANKEVQPVHDRMPVILEKASFDTWLHNTDVNKLKPLLEPIPAPRIKKYRVPELVNKATAEGPELIVACEPMEFFDGELF